MYNQEDHCPNCNAQLKSSDSFCSRCTTSRSSHIHMVTQGQMAGLTASSRDIFRLPIGSSPPPTTSSISPHINIPNYSLTARQIPGKESTVLSVKKSSHFSFFSQPIFPSASAATVAFIMLPALISIIFSLSPASKNPAVAQPPPTTAMATQGPPTGVTTTPTQGPSTGVTTTPTQGPPIGVTTTPTQGPSTGVTTTPTQGPSTIQFTYNKIIQIAGQPEPQPVSIIQGLDGDIWFTDLKNAIGKVTPGGTIQEVFIPKPPDSSSSPAPVGITNGPDGTIWFTLEGSSYVGRIETTAPFVSTSVHYFPLYSTHDISAVAMTAGPDGNLWIATKGDETYTAMVECMTPQGTFQGTFCHNPIPLKIGANPSSIISADGKLWVAEYASTAIVSITLQGDEQTYLLAGMEPLNLASTKQGDIWFTEESSSVGRLGHINASGVQQPDVPLGTMQPQGITIAEDGTIWFTAWPPDAQDVNRAGVIESLLPGGSPIPYAFPAHCLPTHNDIEYDNGNGITIGQKGEIWVLEGGVNQPSITHSTAQE